MEFQLKTIINSSPEEIYKAWLSSEGHSKITGGAASISDQVGDHFTAWDGYIEGKNLELDKNKRIVQSWRTSDFEASEPDSQIEVVLNKIDGQTELTLTHTNLPEHGEQYKEGWINHYFQPMQAYFT